MEFDYFILKVGEADRTRVYIAASVSTFWLSKTMIYLS